MEPELAPAEGDKQWRTAGGCSSHSVQGPVGHSGISPLCAGHGHKSSHHLCQKVIHQWVEDRRNNADLDGPSPASTSAIHYVISETNLGDGSLDSECEAPKTLQSHPSSRGNRC